MPTGDLEEICNSDFERDVLRRLIERGYRVTPQVGALGYRIGLVVEGADGQRLAVECDGAGYHEPERWAYDMRRQRILERVGWRFWRCWASSFTLDPDSCMVDLLWTLERLGIKPGSALQASSVYTAHITAVSGHTSARVSSGRLRPKVRPDVVRQQGGAARGRFGTALDSYGPGA